MKPKSVEVYPVYICPECDGRYCESLEYVNKVGKIICSCGQLLDLDPIKTFNISPVYNNKTQRQKKKKKPEFKPIKQKSDSRNIDRCIDLLVSLGWKKGEAKSRVNKIYQQWNKETNKQLSSDTVEEFAQYVFFNQGE